MTTSASSPLRIPELLAPAGDWDCVRAAVENGADAVYFGLDRFNARMRAHNFTTADLPPLMEFLHRRGVRGYLTFNTLTFSSELPDAEDYLRTVIRAGVDAAIVQDLGIARLIRSLSPDFPIHCSTQMTLTSPAGIDFARRLGAQLVVLARENNFKDIAAIQKDMEQAGEMPLEVFVHGALCVAYSGQCLTSEALGGRSANRGECAQACRLPYGLVSDGEAVDLGDRRYLLSPRDLSGLEVLPELIRLGVTSLKIEGRLKNPEYVASITRVYRKALDRALEAAGQGGGTTQAERYELEMAFSRGLHSGWFTGTDNQALVHARFGTKRGVFLGEILRVHKEAVWLRTQAPIKPGDGVVFDAGTPDKGEEGGRVYEVFQDKDCSVLRFGRGDINFDRVRAGNLLWKTSDPALEKDLRASYAGDKIRTTRPLDLEVHGHAGGPLTVIARDQEGHCAKVSSQILLSIAEKQALDETRLAAQLGRLGGTPFHLGTLETHIEGELMLPMSELNTLRRSLVTELEAQRSRPLAWTLAERDPARLTALALTPPLPTCGSGPELIALVRSVPQLEAAWESGVKTLYCDFENPKRYRDAVARFRELQAGTEAGEIWVAPPRVHKPGEEWILEQVRSCAPDGFLARNPDHLKAYAGSRLRGDFSLNTANPAAVAYLINEYGLERVTASYDLNAAQLEDLLRGCDPSRLDITLHQHMPLFHMEHCVFCAFLSQGKDYHDCGRPCEKHRVELKDRVGALLPLKADAGCRNTVFNNRAQTGAEFLGRFQALGARYFRIEFVDEEPAEVRRTLNDYRRLLAGELSGAELWQNLRLINQLGVTRGQLEAAARSIGKKTRD